MISNRAAMSRQIDVLKRDIETVEKRLKQAMATGERQDEFLFRDYLRKLVFELIDLEVQYEQSNPSTK